MAEAAAGPKSHDDSRGTARFQKWPRISAAAWVFFVAIASAVVLVDQATKCWAVSQLTDASLSLAGEPTLAHLLRSFWTVAHPYPTAGLPVFAAWWHFYYVENAGAAWGFLSHSSWGLRTAFFLTLAVLAMGFLLRAYARTLASQRALRVGLTIVFGGALGNFIDRIRLGYVIDFIDWHLGTLWHWPTFNVADAAISSGVVLLLLDMLQRSPHREAQNNIG